MLRGLSDPVGKSEEHFSDGAKCCSLRQSGKKSAIKLLHLINHFGEPKENVLIGFLEKIKFHFFKWNPVLRHVCVFVMTEKRKRDEMQLKFDLNVPDLNFGTVILRLLKRKQFRKKL